MGKAKAQARPSTRELDKILRTFASSPAQITEKQSYELEAAARRMDVKRRLAFQTLKFSGAELIEKVRERDSALVLAGIDLHLGDYQRFLGTLKELVRKAQTRAQLALCEREDMAELMAAVRAEADAEGGSAAAA